MEKRTIVLSDQEKELLVDVLLNQRYAKELVSSELAEIELGLKGSEERRTRQLNDLLVRLHNAGV
ncbi:antirepressor AbbA [Fictibacillus sp. Mic-4]|uniref:antirepressor AbbA n=1 Tax=Fictibacillus TaxID=1329200 RepID=UPI0004071730|nr:antirepressor AbbA [Fictibacillus gelatini]